MYYNFALVLQFYPSNELSKKILSIDENPPLHQIWNYINTSKTNIK